MCALLTKKSVKTRRQPRFSTPQHLNLYQLPSSQTHSVCAEEVDWAAGAGAAAAAVEEAVEEEEMEVAEDSVVLFATFPTDL